MGGACGVSFLCGKRVACLLVCTVVCLHCLCDVALASVRVQFTLYLVSSRLISRDLELL